MKVSKKRGKTRRVRGDATNVVEVPEHSIGDFGSGVVSMVLCGHETEGDDISDSSRRTRGETKGRTKKLPELGDLLRLLNLSKLDHLPVDLGGEGVGHVKDIGDSSTHSGGEVSSSVSEDDDSTSRHVFASVVSDSLADGEGSRVSDGEPLSSNSSEESGSGGGSVKGDLRRKRRVSLARTETSEGRSRLTFPIITFSSALKGDSLGG